MNLKDKDCSCKSKEFTNEKSRVLSDSSICDRSNLINKEMSIQEIRVAMTKAGWTSQDKLSNIGWGNKFGYSIWFERNDWLGVVVGKISLHSHTDDISEESMNNVVFDTAKKCLDAEVKYVDSVPSQNVYGALTENSILTSLLRDLMSKKNIRKEF